MNKDRIIGVDFGSKRIGLAISDESLSFGFPLKTIAGFGHDKDKKEERELSTKDEILNIINKEGVKTVVFGQSNSFSGEENAIMKDAKRLADFLISQNINIVFEPEVFSTVSATKFQGETDHVDASAAAIILQSYLDRIKFKNNN